MPCLTEDGCCCDAAKRPTGLPAARGSCSPLPTPALAWIQRLPKIFQPFFTTKGIGGTGLGLWVSQEIAERHNGALKVRTSQCEGHSGTVFTLFLPFDAARR